MVSEPNPGSTPSPETGPTGPAQDSLIEYPCVFPIKVMGVKHDDLVGALSAVARDTDPSFDPSTLELRPSSKGTYLGVTLNVRVENREQLDNLYRTLSSHPLVRVVL
ncbi:YbeD family protein [Amphibiibacter pelophylacis]|uniref:DUF493 domain-containing protein n=1 Tax=Amphibiibacter pelophylacis TaxID=1799477 RepID=A0ACC6NXY3_9BURK